MASPLATAGFGLASAASWGAGDFSGGLATRRAPVLSVAFVSKVGALATMVILGLARAEQLPALSALAWASAAGLVGAVGLVALYQALAVGLMGTAAPVSAVIAAAMPVVFAAASEGPPAWWQFAGFGLAITGVWFVSRPDRTPDGASGGMRSDGVGLAALAGIGFGGFYILISQARAASVFWPLAASQTATLLAVLAVAGAAVRMRPGRPRPLPAGLLLLMLLAGVLDAGGNAFFVLAEHAGRLDVAAVLASLYPASTVLLARALLKERVSRTQVVGITAALVAIPLIAG